MTIGLFAAYAVYFVSVISHYRETLPKDLKKQPIILITENHCSRKNAFASLCFKLHNIILLTLPAHCTHIMQPFAVDVASVLKSKMSSLKYNKSIKENANKCNFAAAKPRYLTISSIIQAWNEVPMEVLKKSFEATGISPFNSVYHPPHEKRREYFKTCCQELTSDENILAMYNLEMETDLQSVDDTPKPYYNFLPTFFQQKELTYGCVLSDFPPLLLRKNEDENTFIRVL